MDSLRKGLDNLLHRRANVWTMRKHDIHIRLLQPRKRALQSLNNMLLAQPPRIRLLSSSTKEYLRAKHILISRPSQLTQRITHLDLRLAICVDLGCVEEIYSILPCCGKDVFYDAAFLGAAVGEPATEGEDADFQA